MSTARETLLDLVTSRNTAALGTLHHGEPRVSMVPFAVLPDGKGVVIHVSRLAAHTADMLATPRVSLMVTAAERRDLPAQALPRVTIQGDARQLLDATADARAAYLGRFPDAAAMFELADFSLFMIEPVSIRVISGFGEAATLSAGDFATVMRK